MVGPHGLGCMQNGPANGHEASDGGGCRLRGLRHYDVVVRAFTRIKMLPVHLVLDEHRFYFSSIK
jgi:hypothetical protein